MFPLVAFPRVPRSAAGAVLQRLRRRAIVALAWLVLALAVVPAAAEATQPLAVYVTAASSLSAAAVLGRGGGMRGAEACCPRRKISAGSARSAVAFRAQRVWLSKGVAPGSERVPPLRVCCSSERDERRLYLSICRLSC